ncbi:hypothetical protein L208DRAFT_1459786 [Tricholoma matsutake]|nr:hypothetical protein L208DRAFT_1459786 [Tricholoma matsutake 945]
MQPAGYHPYQFPYYPSPVPQDHELKKQYLALLPPQQIIEICLTFDIHVPPYVRSTIWPLDINAAIAALQKPMHNNENSRAEAPPAMGSLTVAGSASPSDEPAKPDEPQPPDKSASTSLQPQLGGQVNTQTPIPQPPYPYQQYGFHQPQSGYPHASYYGHPPPGYAPYPSPYPYQQFSLHPPPPTQPTPIQLPPPSQPQDAFRDQPAADDLPSYEEMIVEALTDCGDPEGCAPKELFMWMASRYPLQSNFRPSASQALQKAFKRGRFEKSRGGKYRLSATWEGGNTSRRTTRRPQTHQNQPVTGTSLTPQSSPFTHAPLVHQPKPSSENSTQSQSQTHQLPFFGFPYPPLPGYSPQSHPHTAEAQPSYADADTPVNPYEAAQHILQAINFGGLLKIQDEEGKPSVNPVPETPSAALPNPTAVPQTTTQVPHVDRRAELQALLALLAVQLAEVVQEDEDDGAQKDKQLPAAVVTDPPPPTVHTLATGKSAARQEEEEDSDEDMEEVI